MELIQYVLHFHDGPTRKVRTVQRHSVIRRLPKPPPMRELPVTEPHGKTDYVVVFSMLSQLSGPSAHRGPGQRG